MGTEMPARDSTKQRRLPVRLIQARGDWQCGVSVMYMDFNSNNSEYMLLAQNMDAGASMLRIAPEAAYTFADNHAVGARFQYMTARGVMDTVTADLLGNFSATLQNVHASSRSMGGCICERTHIGLDRHGRVGIFWDYTLSYTRTKSQFYMGESSSDYTLNKKISLGFAPGLV